MVAGVHHKHHGVVGNYVQACTKSMVLAVPVCVLAKTIFRVYLCAWRLFTAPFPRLALFQDTNSFVRNLIIRNRVIQYQSHASTVGGTRCIADL
jgi:hypothetical protein